MKELVEFIIKNLVSEPDAVAVTEEVKERETVYTVKIAEEDFGRIIGRRTGDPAGNIIPRVLGQNCPQ